LVFLIPLLLDFASHMSHSIFFNIRHSLPYLLNIRQLGVTSLTRDSHALFNRQTTRYHMLHHLCSLCRLLLLGLSSLRTTTLLEACMFLKTLE